MGWYNDFKARAAADSSRPGSTVEEKMLGDLVAVEDKWLALKTDDARRKHLDRVGIYSIAELHAAINIYKEKVREQNEERYGTIP